MHTTHLIVPNLPNYSPYELVFGRRQKLLLNLETTLDIKVSGTFEDYYNFRNIKDYYNFRNIEDYYNLLNERLKYLHRLLQEFKSKRLAMINKDRSFFQYNSGDLVFIISPPTSQLCTASRKVMINMQNQ